MLPTPRIVEPSLDIAKSVSARDGRAVRNLRYSRPAPMMGPYEYPIRAEIKHPNEPGGWVAWDWMLNGQWKSNEPGNPNDIINIRVN